MTRTRAAGRRALQWILKTLEASNRPMSVSEIADDIEAAGGPALDPRQVAYRITQASDLITPTGGKKRGARYRLRTETPAAPSATEEQTAPTSEEPSYFSHGKVSSDRPTRSPEATALNCAFFTRAHSLENG